jgi:WD40 repeat protein/tRNA A-37 threonylcarbamoyl transferase component Bud32
VVGSMTRGERPGEGGGLPTGFAAGSRVAGYLLEEQIGAGGMAVVFRARDERLHRQVALKILSPALAADEAFRHRFIRESRAAVAVDDPHIIPVFEAGEADGVLFIAMRYVPGGDVRGLVRRVGPLSAGRAAAIISPVASALDAAHDAGLVHRDVKPANMLVDARPGRPDHVYLSDFGLSKSATSSLGVTGSGQFLGTPGYSAPEQMAGKPVDGRADQYSLACAAFELLCGKTPFPRDQVTAVIWAHMSEPPPLLTSRRPGLPPAVDGVLVRALAKAPEDRYASCKEFADALRGTLGLAPYNARSRGASQAGYRRAWPIGPGAAEQNIPAAGVADDATGIRRAQPGTGPETLPSRRVGKHEAHHARASQATPPATVTRPRSAGPPVRSVARRAVRWRHALVAGLLSLTLVAIAAVGVAVYSTANAGQQHAIADQQHAIAGQQHAIALSRQLAAASLAVDSSDPITARQLALASWRVFPTDQANSSMAALETEQEQDGTLFGSSSVQATVTGGVAFSPDGKLLASADGNGYVRLWNPVTGQPVGAPLPADLSRIPQPFAGGVTDVAFSPDGKLLASADGNGYVRLWNPVTGKPVGAPLPADPGRLDNYVTAVAFSPDGKLLASADSNGYVRLWNPVTGQPVGAPLPADPPSRTFQPRLFPGVADVAFSPDGKLLASADGNGYVRLWNPVTGKPVGAPLPADPGLGFNEFVDGVAFSPDGKLLASADGNGYVRLWNPVTGQPVGAPLPADPSGNPGANIPGVRDVAFSPDGELLASADSNGYVRLWNPATGQPVGAPLAVNINSLTGIVGKVAFSPDGTVLASADGNGYLRLWNPATGRPVGAPLPADTASSGGVAAVAFSPDGKLLATAGDDGYVRLWSPVTGQPVGAPLPADPSRPGPVPNGVADVAFSPDGKLLATADIDGYVRLWNPATGQPVGAPLPVDPVRIPQHALGAVTGVAFSPDGKLLATADDDGYVRLWNPATGRPVGAALPAEPNSIPGNPGVDGVAFSPDGKLLATADGYSNVRLWNPTTGRPVGKPLPVNLNPHSAGLIDVAFSPDGKLLATTVDGYVRLWNPATGRPVGASFPAGSPVAFSPDGKLLATAGGNGYVRLWNPATRQPVGIALPADIGPLYTGVAALAFSLDGALLASGDVNGLVQLWRVLPFTDPYAALCAEVGPPTKAEWIKYAPGNPEPRLCS